jgi:hypothetical protein
MSARKRRTREKRHRHAGKDKLKGGAGKDIQKQ